MIDEHDTDEQTDVTETTDTAAVTPDVEQSQDADQADDASTVQADETAEGDNDPDVFDRSYVEDLRKESAGYRTQAKAVGARLHTELVRQTGLLADPADLPFDPAHLDDPDALTAAIDALIEEKPHLKARRFAPGAAAQGPKNQTGGNVDLLGMIQQRI